MDKLQRILLPKTVIPRHYRISLFPDMCKFTYKGKVKIALEILKSIEKIKFHSFKLDLNKITLNQENKNRKEVDVNTLVFDKTEETAEFPLEISSGNADLEIEFTGEINDQMRGFYRSFFKESSGKMKPVGCTQFEAIDARWAFPCWDEPSFKAKFDLDITVPKKFLVLSNMPMKSEKHNVENNVQMKKVTFETSPKMSTYLLAWFIGEYEGKSDVTDQGIRVSIYTPPEQLERGKRALSVAKKTLSFFGKYFNKKYPLPKMDMLAINDFVNGAMENWGLVTYRDVAILSDENSSSRANERVTEVVAHELAHQWFGNLVTMEWWDQLWLNEGFATFMAALSMSKNYPEFNVMDTFVSETFDVALYLDSLESSHPIEVEIKHPKEINEVFDVISYNKGASVLRMLFEYIGEDCFKNGVSNYLNKYEYQNVDSDVLWESLSEASGKKLQAFMHGFTRKQGYPIVEVEELESAVGDEAVARTRRFRLTQQRFFLNSEIAEERGRSEKDATVWHVPIKVSCGGEGEWVYLDCKTKEFELRSSQDFVLFNSGATGFFRVHHKGNLMKGIEKAIAEKRISASDRYQVLSDAKALFVSGRINSQNLLDLLKAYEGEENETVWGGILGVLHTLRGIVRRNDEPVEKKLNLFSNQLTSRIISKIGLEKRANDSFGMQKLRADIVSERANCEQEEVLQWAKEKFSCVTEKKEIDSNVFGSVLRTAIKQGGARELEAIKEISETTKDPSLKNQALLAVGYAKQKDLIADALNYALSEKVRRQDSHIVYSGVVGNKHGTKSSWEFFKKNYDMLRETFSHDSLFSRFVAVVARLDCDSLLSDAEAFFEVKDTKGYEKKLRQCFESARMKVRLGQREFQNVATWLESKGY